MLPPMLPGLGRGSHLESARGSILGIAVSRAWSCEAREGWRGAMLCVGSAVKAAGKLEKEVCRWGAEDGEMEEWRREIENWSW